MQHRLFVELSSMFGQEVPLYDKSLIVNHECNSTVCKLLGQLFCGFQLSSAELDHASGERHGAIRIGTAREYRLVARYFAAFSMLPHNYYDMTNVGARSQPVVATAFRSSIDPAHRIFCSLLLTDHFDDATKARVDALLATRQVFSEQAIELLAKEDRDGGLSSTDADALIREGTERIFRWTGKARDYQLYQSLCAAGFKIAADIACFESHHLNHLTPNTLWMDLYTAAMKFCLGDWSEDAFRVRAALALTRLQRSADRDHMRLHFRQLPFEAIESFPVGRPSPTAIGELVEQLTKRLQHPDLVLRELDHSGFKDVTEGPSEDTPVLLRQDSYRALTEPVAFRDSDGTVTNAEHSARFGEIEQRFYATTPTGRALYDSCLAAAEVDRERHPDLAESDLDAYEVMYAKHFAAFPKTLRELLRQRLVYGDFAPASKGIAEKSRIDTTDLWQLIDAGYVRYEGLRYEDFLPVSAAAIFASNLNESGTRTTAAVRPVYTQAMLETVMDQRIIEADALYRAMEARSLLMTYERLGLLAQLPLAEKAALDRAVAANPVADASLRAADRRAREVAV